jgi:hypothetical protein
VDLACLFERRQTDALLVASVGIRTQTHTATALLASGARQKALCLHTQSGLVRCFSMALQATSASANVLNGEPPIFIAPRL